MQEDISLQGFILTVKEFVVFFSFLSRGNLGLSCNDDAFVSVTQLKLKDLLINVIWLPVSLQNCNASSFQQRQIVQELSSNTPKSSFEK